MIPVATTITALVATPTGTAVCTTTVTEPTTAASTIVAPTATAGTTAATVVPTAPVTVVPTTTAANPSAGKPLGATHCPPIYQGAGRGNGRGANQ